MRERREISGLHFYDRDTGIHVLFDEIEVPAEEAAKIGPRQLSVMLTDECNISCSYCYAPKGVNYISEDMLSSIAAAADELQVLDLTFGGGEPTMHPRFADFMETLRSRHEFALSVTTNGLFPDVLLAAAPFLSSARISIDNVTKRYTRRRAQLLRELSQTTHVGVNLLVPPGDQTWLSETLAEFDSTGVFDVLLLPQHDNGRFCLSDEEWTSMDKLPEKFSSVQFSITAGAMDHSSLPTLITSDPNEFLFAHIDALGGIHDTSWGPAIGVGAGTSDIISSLRRLNPLRRAENESMVRTSSRPFG